MTKKKILLIVLTFNMTLNFCFSQESETPATDSVKLLIETAKKYKDENEKGISKEEKESRIKIREKISSILDLKEMASLILKNKWSSLKESEKIQYADLLSSLVEKIGYPQIGSYFNKDLKIEYLSESKMPSGDREVGVRITYPNDEFILSTKFLLKNKSGNWRIYDVITDGDSLLLIYRNQHMSIIKEKGFQELLKLMRKKLNSADTKK
ncbi:MAG: ABC transporter substrate-binding protein [Elusimicrobia bacterium]|nr:ABC transporter substrate-binding protein [Elusimicrobiota bacterium]